MGPDARAWLERAEEDPDTALTQQAAEKALLNPTLRAAVREFQQRSRIQRVIVFGSQARGQPGPESDVDLLLVDPRFEGVKSFRRARGLHEFWPLDVPVGFLCYTPEEFEALRSRPTVVREAAEHGVEA